MSVEPSSCPLTHVSITYLRCAASASVRFRVIMFLLVLLLYLRFLVEVNGKYYCLLPLGGARRSSSFVNVGMPWILNGSHCSGTNTWQPISVAPSMMASAYR